MERRAKDEVQEIDKNNKEEKPNPTSHNEQKSRSYCVTGLFMSEIT